MKKEEVFKTIAGLIINHNLDVEEFNKWFTIYSTQKLPLEVIYDNKSIGLRSRKVEKFEPLVIVINQDFAISVNSCKMLVNYQECKVFCDKQKVIGISGVFPILEQCREINRAWDSINFTLKMLKLAELDESNYCFQNKQISAEELGVFNVKSNDFSYEHKGLIVNILPVFNF